MSFTISLAHIDFMEETGKSLEQVMTLQLLIQSDGGSLVAKSCPTLSTPWAIALQAPLSMGFSRQEYWSRCCPHKLSSLTHFPLYSGGWIRNPGSYTFCIMAAPGLLCPPVSIVLGEATGSSMEPLEVSGTVEFKEQVNC